MVFHTDLWHLRWQVSALDHQCRHIVPAIRTEIDQAARPRTDSPDQAADRRHTDLSSYYFRIDYRSVDSRIGPRSPVHPPRNCLTDY